MVILSRRAGSCLHASAVALSEPRDKTLSISSSCSLQWFKDTLPSGRSCGMLLLCKLFQRCCRIIQKCKTKPVSNLPFLGWTGSGWSSWAHGYSRVQRHKGRNQAECCHVGVWPWLGAAGKHPKSSPQYTIRFALWPYQLGRMWILRPGEGTVLPFCVR